jgi:hypothetical protein
MSPGNTRRGAGLRDFARQDGIAKETLRLVQFAGIHIGFAGVASGVDEKLRTIRLNRAW